MKKLNSNFRLSRAIIVLLILVVSSADLFSQNQISHYNLLCPTAPGQEYGKSIINRRDQSGYAIAGYEYNNPSCIGSYDWMFLKLRADGSVDCARVLGQPYDDKCFSVIQTPTDSGYFLAGYTTDANSPFRRKATFMKLNKNCNTITCRGLFDSLNSSYHQVITDPTNYVTFAGYNETHITVNTKRNKILASKYFPTAAPFWVYRYVSPGPSREEAMSICSPVAGGGHCLAAKTDFYSGVAGRNDIMLVKLDFTGAIVWRKVYRITTPTMNNYNAEPRKIIPMPDGGYAVVGFTNVYGNTQRDIFVMRVNSTGGLIWSSTYGDATTFEEGHSIAFDGSNLVVTGFQNIISPPKPSNAFILKIPVAGGPPIFFTLWDTANGTDAGYDIITSTTGAALGYAVTGNTYRGALLNDAFLWRTNLNGIVSTTDTCNIFPKIPYRTNLHKLDSFPLNRVQVQEITRPCTNVSPPSQKSTLCIATAPRPNKGGEETDKYSLEQNSPNPFNPTTTINYQLPVAGFTSINVFDIAGRLVSTLVNEFKVQGSYNVTFDGSNLSSGVYYYKIETEGFTNIKKMILIK
ncbi:MAG: T9SS type A sorting domain-containing protein [Bacteroidota bacterium]|nr:T9SS type A sorting domain-containing protein [Bacteroidota bacterium]